MADYSPPVPPREPAAPLCDGDVPVTEMNVPSGVGQNTTEAFVGRTRRPNQYVEHIKYNCDDDSEDSDCRDDCKCDEHGNLNGTHNNINSFLKDFPCNSSSRDEEPIAINACTKPHVNTMFASPYDHVMMPVSFLNLFCQRLEDNYDLDMDNIIIYVTNIIEQLKKISSGEYLTTVAREKWLAMEYPSQIKTTADEKSKIVTASACMPLHLEKKISRTSPTWSDIVRTDMDMRSLSKMFERKILIEVPKMLAGTYRLFSESCGNRVTIECKENVGNAYESSGMPNFNLTFQIRPSLSGHFSSNIDTVCMLEGRQTSPRDAPESIELAQSNKECAIRVKSGEMLDLSFRQLETGKSRAKVVELTSATSDADVNKGNYNTSKHSKEKLPINTLSRRSSNSSNSLADVFENLSSTNLGSKQMFLFNQSHQGDLKTTIENLNIQSCLQEESNEESSVNNREVRRYKKNTNHRSPYESQAHVQEEKRRKRLLKMRDNRENRKKFPKNYGRCAKGNMAPSATSSVTQLSISNKSFYNNIYGQLGNVDNSRNQQLRAQNNQKREKVWDETTADELELLVNQAAISLNNKAVDNDIKVMNGTQFANVLSELKYRPKDASLSLIRKKERTKVLKQVESSTMSSESSSSIHLQSMAKLLVQDLNNDKITRIKDKKYTGHINMLHDTTSLDKLQSTFIRAWPLEMNDSSSTKISTIESRVLDVIQEADRVSERKYPSRVNLDCRESIDRIYDLMRKIGKTDNIVNTKTAKTKFTSITLENSKNKLPRMRDLTIRDIDSGMSMKLSNTSVLSSYSGEKHSKNIKHKLMQQDGFIEQPKVIIYSKNSGKEWKPERKIPEEKNNKDLKRGSKTFKMPPHNPLPAISHLLQEVNHMQRVRKKTSPESRIPKQINLPPPNTKRNPSKRISRLDQHIRGIAQQTEIKTQSHNSQSRTIKTKMQNINKTQENQMPIENIDKQKPHKNIINDLAEEVKELRGGEARGLRTPVAVSRLDALAQPRKVYVQAHSEQFRHKYGRNLISDRLHRLAHAPPLPHALSQVGTRDSYNVRNRRNVAKDIGASKSTKAADNQKYECRSTSSPDAKTMPVVNEDIPTLKALGQNYTLDVSVEKSSTTSEINTENDFGFISWQMNLQDPRRSYISLTPNHSEKGQKPCLGDFKIGCCPSLSSVTSLDTIENQTLNDIFDSVNDENLDAYGENASVLFNPKDLVYTDIIDCTEPLNNENILKFKNCEELTPEDKHQEATIICYKDICDDHKANDNMSVIHLQDTFRISKLSLSTDPSSRNLLVLQAGDASTVVTVHSPVQSLTDNLNCCAKISAANNMINLAKETIWDMRSIPIQVSTVGYSFPIVCPQNSINNAAHQRTANAIEYSIVQNPPDRRDVECLDTLDNTARKEKLQNIKTVEDKSDATNHVTDSNTSNGLVENTSKDTVNLDCTSSLDVLVNLLNEIRNISTRQTHIANSVEKYSYQEEKKPEASYKIKTTMENSTTYDVVTVSSNENIQKLEPDSGFHSVCVAEKNLIGVELNKLQGDATSKLSTIFEDKSVTVKMPQNELVSQCTATNSQYLLQPMSCKGTSVTSLLLRQPSESECTESTIDLQKKCTDLLPYRSISLENVDKGDPYQVVSVYKRHSSGKLLETIQKKKLNESEVQIESDVKCDQVVPEQCDEEDEVPKVKRDILVSVYAVLVFGVFAAMSYPDILLLQS